VPEASHGFIHTLAMCVGMVPTVRVVYLCRETVYVFRFWYNLSVKVQFLLFSFSLLQIFIHYMFRPNWPSSVVQIVFHCRFHKASATALDGLHLYSAVLHVYCILASCYIRLTLNICSFVRQCNTFTS
jgi:hypothetical protein